MNIYEILGFGLLGTLVLFVILVNDYRSFFKTINTYMVIYFKVRVLNRTFLYSKTRVRKSVTGVNGLLKDISNRYQVVFERSDQYVFYYVEITELLKEIENILNKIGELNRSVG